MHKRYDSLGTTQPLVTVVITNYNYGRFIARAIESVQTQDYQNLEILVADDASTDNSVAIVKELSRIDPRLRLISQVSNVGLARNKQSACHQASGAFLTFLDADDYLCSVSKVSAEVELILNYERETGSTCVAYSGRRTIINGQPKQTEPSRVEHASGNIFMGLITRELSQIPRDFTLRSESFWESGGFDETSVLYVDWVLKIRLASRLPFFPTGVEGIAYVKHDGAMSSVGWEQHRKAIWRAYWSHRKLIPRGKQRWDADLLMWNKFGNKRALDIIYRRLLRVRNFVHPRYGPG